MSWFLRCSWCGDPLEEGERCQRCTCKWCVYALREGSCWICPPRDEYSSIDAPNSLDDLPNGFTHPSQPQYETYLCELCGNDSHYGYDCPPQLPLVYEQEPSYNQNFSDNYYPQNSPSFPQQFLCCENCGGPHESFQCQPRNQNFFELNPCYDFNPSGFNQTPQYSIDHQPQIIQEDQQWISDKLIQSNKELFESMRSMFEEFCERMQTANISTHTPEPSIHFDSFYDDDDYEESTIPFNEIVSQIPPSIVITPVLPTLEPEDSLIMRNEELSTIPEKESDEFIKSSVEDLVPIPSESEDTSRIDSECDFLRSLSIEDVPEDNVKIYSNPLFEFDDEYLFSDVNPLFDEVLEDIENKDFYEPALLVTPQSDANEDEYNNLFLKSLLINDTIPNLPPEDCMYEVSRRLRGMLSLVDPAVKSWRTSLVLRTFVPIPSESEDTSDNESECDVLVCDDSSPLDVSEDNPVIFSNPLLDSNEDFTSSDDESLSEEDIPKETFKIYSNPLFEFDDDFTSSDVNPLFNEVLEDVESEDSFDSKLVEPTLLISPLSDANKDECFDPGGDEINAFLDLDISDTSLSYSDNSLPEFESFSDHTEETSSGSTTTHANNSLTEYDSFHFEIEPDKSELTSVVMEDILGEPRVYTPNVLPTHPTLMMDSDFIIRTFLPFFTYPVISSSLFSFGSEDTIFDPGISTFHFSSLKPVAYENPIVIFLFICFCPKDKGIRG
ncbi:hypothetical protein Tco_0898090 [Tanacetum coccineum]